MYSSSSMRIEGVSCHRGGRLVLADINFGLHPQVPMIVRGANGVGKSTLLRVIAGLVDHQAGCISWCFDDGRAATPSDAIHDGLIHYIGHADAVKPALSVYENTLFWAQLVGGEGRVDQALEVCGLSGLRDVPGQFLSAGQKRRLSLSRLLLVDKPLWLLDEPTNALDGDGVALAQQIMLNHLEMGGLLLASSHVDLRLPDLVTLRLNSPELLGAPNE